MQLVAEQATSTIAAQKKINDAALSELRKELDSILEYQADRAPSWVSIEGSEYPEREGSLKDFLAARQMFAEAEMLDEDEEIDEEGEDDIDEVSDDKMVDVQTGPAAVEETGDASSAPESTVAAVGKSPAEHGDEQVIAEKLHNLTLDQEIQEASPASKAKLKMELNVKPEEVKSPKTSQKSPKKLSSPLKSPKKPVASPLKKQQSKASLHKSQLPVRSTTPRPPWKT
jgi:hypothetical protein